MIDTIAISLATLRTWISSGLLSPPTRSDRAAIRPISVLMPVAVTTARASPAMQALPLNTMFSACSRATVASLGPGGAVDGLRLAGQAWTGRPGSSRRSVGRRR